MLIPPDPVLQPGDRVVVVCPDRPELCVNRAVGPDGTIDLPGLGALAAALKRPAELAYDIASRLDDGRIPTRVDVRFVGSAPGDISVSGAVERSLTLYAPHGIARERLLQAASPTRNADLTFVKSSSRLRPGTVWEIPSITAARRIEVVGSVARPTTLPPANALPLSSAIEAAGGITPHGDPNDIVVIRSGESIPLTLAADAGFLLGPGDVVRIGTIADRRYVIVRGLVAHPGSIEFAKGMTATQALNAAGGLLPNATGGMLVWGTGTKSFRLSIAFLLNRRIPDPVLSPNDSLDIEARRP